MDAFSIGGAWSFGFRFFGHRPALHLLLLIGLGLILPTAVQFALTGQAMGTSSPVLGGSQAALARGPIVVLVQLLGYVVQLASYFACWRLGLSAAATVPGALRFGLLAGLLAAAIFALVGAPALIAMRAAFSSGIPFLGLLVGLIPIILVVAIFYTLPAALIATVASLLLVLSMVLGTATGNVGLAATLIGGGSGAVVVLFLVLSVILLWLTARLSCTTALMADWQSYNLVAAIRESWRLTLEDQWAILRYLALLAFGMAVILVLVSVGAGVGIAAALRGGGLAGVGQIAALAIGLLVGIPFVILNVIVPAGIYRQLTRSTMAAEVFA